MSAKKGDRKMIPVRMNLDILDEIDAVRGEQPRDEWLVMAAREKLFRAHSTDTHVTRVQMPVEQAFGGAQADWAFLDEHVDFDPPEPAVSTGLVTVDPPVKTYPGEPTTITMGDGVTTFASQQSTHYWDTDNGRWVEN